VFNSSSSINFDHLDQMELMKERTVEISLIRIIRYG